MVRKAFDFFIYTSLFIAVCAVLMVWQTIYLFEPEAPFALYGFVFSGSVCSYNFHWYLTPPHVAGQSEKLSWSLSNKSIHLVLFIAGLVGAGICALLLLEHWFWLGITAFFTFLYSAPKIPHPFFSFLKKIALGKTIFLAFAWTHVTVTLPLLISFSELQPAHICFVVNRFFYLYAICILFDYRDVEEDKKAGIRSMITYLNEKGIDILFWGSMIVCGITSLILVQFMSSIAVLLLILPAVALALLYYPSKKNFSDYHYYFVLDGLMMISAPLLLLTKFAR